MDNDNVKPGEGEKPVAVAPASTAAAPPINPAMPIQFVLTVAHVNLVLKGLSKLPLEESIEVFQSVKGQGDMAIAVAQGLAGKMQAAGPGPNGTGSGPANKRRRH